MEEALEFLDLTNKTIKIDNDPKIETSLDYDKRCFKDSCTVEIMSDYDKDEKEVKFQNAYHTCNVCLEEKSGLQMMEFIHCNHAYCNDCMKSYFEVQIKDGNVNNLTCPFNKCETQALPLQVFNSLRFTHNTFSNHLTGLQISRQRDLHKIRFIVITQFI